MIPGGWIAKTIGPKLCVTGDCALQAIALLLFPIAGRKFVRTTTSKVNNQSLTRLFQDA